MLQARTGLGYGGSDFEASLLLLLPFATACQELNLVAETVLRRRGEEGSQDLCCGRASLG